MNATKPDRNSCSGITSLKVSDGCADCRLPEAMHLNYSAVSLQTVYRDKPDKKKQR